jgi:hypothetical protein
MYVEKVMKNKENNIMRIHDMSDFPLPPHLPMKAITFQSHIPPAAVSKA